MAAQISHEYVLSALRAGFGVSQIANGLGVSPSAVTQVIETYNLAELAAQNSKFKNIDDGLNSIEEKLVQKLDKSLNLAVLNPMQLTHILKVVNGAKRRSLSEGQTIQQQNNVQLVQLNLPKRHLPKVVHNSNNEVIEVEGRVLQTLPSGKLAVKATEAKSDVPESQALKDLL